MSCTSPYPFAYSVTYPAPCDACQDCGTSGCCGSADAKCVVYTGAALPCSGIATNDNLEVAIQKIDEQICSIIGNYATYNTYCLAPITTQQQFVETISQRYCQLRDEYDFFINTTFVNYQAQVNVDIHDAMYPAVTCAVAGVTNVDSVATVLTKYCTVFNNLWSAIDISGVTWNGCFTVPTPPATIAEGFDLLASQICSVASSSATLPTFNNIGSCLPSPGAADTLVQTIDKIKTRLCQTPTFDINALTWGCITKPSTTTTNLQAAFQSILTVANDYTQNKLTFSADFVVTQTNPSDPCQGQTLALATPVVSTDRLVASNVADLSPGTLMQKLTPGTNISLDDTTTPGQVIINATGLTDTYKVKAASGDTTPNYLVDKLSGLFNPTIGLGISDSYNAVSETVELIPSINWSVFADALLTAIDLNPTLKAKFCGMVCTCDCGTSTTTTTTTTAAPVFYDYYNAEKYACVDCGTLVATVPVAFPIGTPVLLGRYYLATIADGMTYKILATTGSTTALILMEPGFLDCATACTPAP